MSASSTVHVREIEVSDHGAWIQLFRGYSTFYGRDDADHAAATLWDWLHDPAHEVEGALAILDDKAVGFAHFRRMPSPLRGAYIGFLDDLFVDPAARGNNVGEAMFAYLEGVRAARGWPVIRWITADDNYRARGLYDRIGRKTAWNTYEMLPPEA